MRNCIFCRETAKLSLEHVWPQWIWKLSHKEPQTGRYTVETFGTHIERRIRKAPMLDQTRRVVCESCNNGWLSRLENKMAKPVLQRFVVPQRGATGLSISLDDQVALVAWATKMAFILDYTTVTPTNYRHFSQDERQGFAATFTPPDGMAIWIADLVRDTGRITHSSVTNVDSLALATAPDLQYGGQLSTFHVGSLVFQTLHLRSLNDARVAPSDDLMLEPHWNQVVRRIWPSHEVDISWPPQFSFDQEALKDFEQRLGKNPPVKRDDG